MSQDRFAQRAIDVPVSGIGYMMSYASRYSDVVSLGQGTPQFSTPQFIYDQVYQRAKADPSVGMYASPEIENQLLQAIAKYMEEIYGFRSETNCLYLTVGGIGALFASLMAFVEKGDEVIFFDPSYPLHLSQIHLTQAKPVFVAFNEKDAWRLDLNKLEKAITPRTKVVILTNPNNPTGTVLTEEEVRGLAEVVLDHNLVLVLDEAYEFLTYGRPLFSPLKIPKLRKNIILCKSFSKEFAMTGWRIGYVYADREIIAKINDIHTYFAISPPTISIIAAQVALTDKRGKEAMQDFRKKFVKARQVICERLDQLPKLFSYHPPEGTYYVFPKILGMEISAWDFAKLLVDEAKVITIPGSSMGPSGEGHLRLSFAADVEVIHEAFDRLEIFAKKRRLFK